MTIKEMEEITGMSRTNIRFYEAEGLIHPRRRENGYREYSDEDAQILMKVKLLRRMDVPLDQVKAAACGQRLLRDILDELDKNIATRQVHQERTRQALQQMQQDGTEFADLKPEEYLSILENGESVEDAPPRLNLPWRRYWARCLDFSLYNTLVSFLIYDFQHRIILVPILTLFAIPSTASSTQMRNASSSLLPSSPGKALRMPWPMATSALCFVRTSLETSCLSPTATGPWMRTAST